MHAAVFTSTAPSFAARMELELGAVHVHIFHTRSRTYVHILRMPGAPMHLIV